VIVNDLLQCFWFVPTGDLWRVDYQRLEEQPQNATSNTTPEVTAQDGTASRFSLTCASALCVFDRASQTVSARLSGIVVWLLLRWTLRILTGYGSATFAFQQLLLPFSCCRRSL
jgi:hypothetical protein